ncbi:MAG TPA: sulfite oxidase [Burkholderiales bacterium]|nr:sulfite oxidase [Burkholderiales bacterium]
MAREHRRGDEGKLPQTRREFITRLAGAGAAAAMGGAITETFAQEKPAAVPPNAPPADPAGTIPNAAVMAEKNSAMQTHSDRPLTGSVPAEQHNFAVTPTDRMFVRNNHLTPDLPEASHKLTVKGLVDKELSFSVAELKKAFPAVTMQGMLECAGSGRSNYVPNASGTRWNPTGGMGCPKWTGVRLRDVLAAAGVKSNAVHVSGQGGDFGVVATAAPVIRSIPLAKAMEPNTLIAWGMNDGPLPKVHGFPLRLVTPGWVGSASTKWLHTLTVLDAPFKGTYMDGSYRIPRNPIKPGERMPKDAVITEAWPVKSMITHPAPNAVFKAGKPVLVEGRAWVGEGAIEKVEVSFNEGVSWQRASVNSGGDQYAWRVFSFEYTPRTGGYVTVLARATDDKGNMQPIVPAWNPLGYFWNGIHRVGFVVEA